MSLFDLIVVQPIFNLLVLIYSVVPWADFGIALIILTIIIRLLLWPLLKRQLHQVKVMRKIQPELAKIRKRAKGNKQLEGMQMLELYKKHGVKPFRSILILLIQLPIFLALYQVIQIFTLHRGEVAKYTYDFLENIPTIRLIIEQPDKFNEKLFGVIDLTQHAISPAGVNIALVILALIAAGTQYILSKQTMPHDGKTKRLRDILAQAGEGKQPDQAEMNAAVMQKMMKFLPIMMFLIMVNLPAALALYYAVSNIVAAIQQHIILKQDEDELEKIAEEPQKKARHREKQAQEAKVIKKSSTKPRDTIKSETTVTRITAKDTGRRK